MTNLPKVVISQRRLTHYRLPLFEILRSELAERNIQLELLVGHGSPAEVQKNDSGYFEWAKQIPTYYFAGHRMCWQPIHRYLGKADLVVVTQENALLVNHLLMLLPRNYRLAFWGHGANLQSNNPNGIKERFKRWTTNRVDWWFAYTGMSADLVSANGFPANRVTVLNNAVDTSELRYQLLSITDAEKLAMRQSLGLGYGPVGIFVGSLYEGKRLDFLFAAAEAIQRKVANFNLLVLGDGPVRDDVRAWCDAHHWAQWIGARFGREKTVCLSMAQVMLNPGAVGLGILDAFVCGVPMLTTDCGNHGPEIAYLKNDVNGVMTANVLEDYTAAAVRLLRDPVALDGLRTGCAKSADEYTLENMVSRFADGIESALGTTGNFK